MKLEQWPKVYFCLAAASALAGCATHSSSEGLIYDQHWAVLNCTGMFPDYPAASRRRGEQGTIALDVELDGKGHGMVKSIAKSSGYKTLDDAAVTTFNAISCRVDGVVRKGVQHYGFSLKE